MGLFNYSKMADFLPYKDLKVCERVRKIAKEEICNHPNENLNIRIIEDDNAFSFAFLLDIVTGIKKSLDEGKSKYVIILPAPNPMYAFLAEMINQLNISCKHVHTFNMDEYADQDGNSAPRDWKGGFQYWMWKDFYSRIKPELRMPEEQIHIPSSENVNIYSSMLEDLGGADVCYGGIGWSGHIAFIEPHLAADYADINAFLEQGTMIVDLNPITVCQNSLYADGGGAGDWSVLPPKAVTIGPKDIAGAKRLSSWNGFGCGDSIWQRFITRLALYGPVTPQIPASILQIFNSDVILSGSVAANCATETCERKTNITF